MIGRARGSAGHLDQSAHEGKYPSLNSYLPYAKLSEVQIGQMIAFAWFVKIDIEKWLSFAHECKTSKTDFCRGVLPTVSFCREEHRTQKTKIHFFDAFDFCVEKLKCHAVFHIFLSGKQGENI